MDQAYHTALVLKREPLAGQVDLFVRLPAKACLQGQLALAQANGLFRRRLQEDEHIARLCGANGSFHRNIPTFLATTSARFSASGAGQCRTECLTLALYLLR
jgi:hypothetical protein